MKMLLHVDTPHEPFTLVRAGSAGDTLNKILDSLKPQAAYLTGHAGRRAPCCPSKVASPSDVPRFAEPFFLKFNANWRFRIVMSPRSSRRRGSESSASGGRSGGIIQSHDPRPGRRVHPGARVHAARDTRCGARPSHAMAVGARVHDDRQTVTVLVPTVRSDRALRNLGANGRVAFTSGHVSHEVLPAQGDLRLLRAGGRRGSGPPGGLPGRAPGLRPRGGVPRGHRSAVHPGLRPRAGHRDHLPRGGGLPADTRPGRRNSPGLEEHAVGILPKRSGPRCRE